MHAGLARVTLDDVRPVRRIERRPSGVVDADWEDLRSFAHWRTYPRDPRTYLRHVLD